MADEYKVYVKSCVEWWKSQVGKDCGKTNEYSAFMDSYKFYNYPKNGSANSCAIFYDTAIMKTMTPEPNANAGRAILCEPNVDNCGAGCTQKVQYYKSAGRYYTKHSDAHTGDEIFFKKSNGAVYHTGAVVDWDNKGFYVVEGNTNGGKVAEKFYPYGDSRIHGFGRPKWSEAEKPKTEPEPSKPAEQPTSPVKSVDELAKEVIAGKWGNGKERATKLKAAGYDYDAVQKRVNELLGVGNSKGKTYTVRVNTKLNVRAGAGTNYKIVRQLSNGDKVNVTEQQNGFGKIKDGEWVCMAYLK